MSSFAACKNSESATLATGEFPSPTQYVENTLRSMLNDQSDHVFSKFSEAYIKYRKVVVLWMVDVADYFNLHTTTTHAAIAYLDRLQPNEKYTRFEWQMMAICCLIISSKYNECEEHVPALHKLEEITQQALSNECVLNYELWALKRMGWKLYARTPMAFLESYVLLAQHLPAGTLSPHAAECLAASPAFYNEITSLATKCLVDHSFKALPASAIATGILYFSLEKHCPSPVATTSDGMAVTKMSGSNTDGSVWCPELTRICGHDAPTSKSVQNVLYLLDAMAHDESVAAGAAAAAAAATKVDSTATAPVVVGSSIGEIEDSLNTTDSSEEAGVSSASQEEDEEEELRRVEEDMKKDPAYLTPAAVEKSASSNVGDKNEISPVSIAAFEEA